MENCKITPKWAPRVSQQEIRRLYETDARGIYDEELIDEVGYGLLARCQSFIEASEARAGKVHCPCCSVVIQHGHRKEEILRCACGWELSWGEYFKTIQHVQLRGAEPVLEQFRAFVNRFPRMRTPREKMLAIDRLIHGFHWYYKTNAPIGRCSGIKLPARPVAVNLIEGRLNKVVEFLDQLTYGDKSTPGTMENYAEWDENINVNRNWYRSRRKEKETQPENPPDKK